MDAGNVFKIQITKSCRKQIDRAPAKVQLAVELALDKIAASPCSLPGAKAMAGEWAGRYRYRLGDYRIIYKVEAEIVTVIVVAFGPRGDIYK